jgi:protein-S-isoprenylcysteine O-methyltransferase Ste14
MKAESGEKMFPAAILTLILCWALFGFAFHHPASQILFIFGNGILIIGILLIILAMRTLRVSGKVDKATDITTTTTVVTQGIYGLVRHPLYLGWLLTYPAAMLVSQHWIIVIIGVIGMASMVLITRAADSDLVEKFGTAYADYMHEVPQLNILLGIMRKLIK